MISSLIVFMLGFALGLLLRQSVLRAALAPMLRAFDARLRGQSIAVGLMPPPWQESSRSDE